MAEPFKFRDKIVGWCGGHVGLLTRTRDVLTDAAYRPAPDVKEPALRLHVWNAMAAVVEHDIRDPLTNALADHMDAVRSEYEVFEGEEPAEAGAAGEWHGGLNQAYEESFVGEVSGIMSPEVLHQTLHVAKASIEIVDAILAAPLHEPSKVAEMFGVTAEEMEALVAHAKQPDGPTPVSFGLADIARSVKARIAEGGDLLDLDEAVRTMFRTADRNEFAAAMAVITDDEAEQSAIFDFTETRPVDPDADSRDADEVLRLALAKEPPAAQTPPAAAAAPAERPRSRRARSTSAPVPTDRTRGAQQVLEGLAEYTSLTEEDVAKVIGVSRGMMVKYRDGATLFDPSPEQANALRKVISDYATEVIRVRDAFLAALPAEG